MVVYELPNIGNTVATKKVVSIADARREKDLERKEAKLAELAERFESVLPTKATPVKDYLKAKKKKKKKK